MLKGSVKISLLTLALIAIVLIPGNTQLVFGYGSGGGGGAGDGRSDGRSDGRGGGGSTTCGNEQPAKVVLYQPNHALLPRATGPNQIRLNWIKTAKATKYTVAFGVSSGNYIYGLPDVGDTDNFTVNYLTPGRTYYFAVRGVNGCMPGPWSMEWAARAGGGSVALLANAGAKSPNVVTPPNMPTVPSNAGINPENATVQQPPTQMPQQVVPVQPTPAPQIGFFQRIWNRIFGR